MAAGGQDRPDIRGPPPAERHRPLECGDQRLGAVGGVQPQDVGGLGAQLGDPGRGGAGEEFLGDPDPGRGTPARLLSGGVPRDVGVWSWPVVVGIKDADLTRRHQAVFGVDLAGDR